MIKVMDHAVVIQRAGSWQKPTPTVFFNKYISVNKYILRRKASNMRIPGLEPFLSKSRGHTGFSYWSWSPVMITQILHHVSFILKMSLLWHRKDYISVTTLQPEKLLWKVQIVLRAWKWQNKYNHMYVSFGRGWDG